jgi:hypothetical protein
MVPEDGLEPSRGQAPRDFKSLVSTTSTTQALSGEGTAGWTQSSISGAAFQLGPRLHLERFVAASDSPVKPVIKTHADRRVVFSAPCASHNIDYGPLGGIGDHERSVLGNANRAPPGRVSSHCPRFGFPRGMSPRRGFPRVRPPGRIVLPPSLLFSFP